MKQTYVSPTGDRNAKIAVVGEQPGLQEIRHNPPKPFVGPAGRMLDECLAMARITRSSLYITNVIKDLDKPLRQYINIDKKGKYSISKEGYQYINELSDELRSLNLNIVVACGSVALLALTNRIGITKWRGSVIESTIVDGLKVIPTFHPATIIPPKFNFLNKPLIIEDLILSKKESHYKEIKRKPRHILIEPTFEEAMSALNYCYEVGLKGTTIDPDIEVINGEVDCIAFAWAEDKAISIPFRCQQGDYFTVEQELEIMLAIDKIISDRRIAKRGANFIFDAQFLFHKYGIIPRGEIHCTQIAQKIMLPDYPAGLDFVTNQHTDVPYYKQDGKKWMKMGAAAGTWEEWWNYNGMDTIITNASHPKQLEILIKQQNEETYDRQRKLIKPLIYMAERGIKIDIQGMVKLREKEKENLDGLLEQLHREVGYEINHNSAPQMIHYFYEECGIKPYKNRKTGKPTSDIDALKRIARRNIKGSKVARLMLDIRSLSKRISTYLNIGKVEEDGRYRSSYKPVGAETGRLSSGETIFGTGGNQQNWPHDLLRFFLFDEGYIGYSYDLSQIENRIVAHVGGVISQIEAFKQGIDLHRLTASVIIGKPYDEISGEDGSSPLGDGRQSERYWGKKGNHATNYDVGYKTFALKNEMTETEAKIILENIHKGYPQIRGGYHEVIRKMLFNNRTVTNLMGRNRLFLGPIHPSVPNVPRHFCLNTYREAYAQLPQSTTADKINEQGLEYVYYNQHLFKLIELLAQIHDSIVFQIPLSLPWIEHAKMLMLIKESLEQPLYWHESEIETPVDLCIGLNMYKEEMVEIKHKQFPSSIEKLADKLKEVYDDISKAKT